jgi:hypothetical protein
MRRWAEDDLKFLMGQVAPAAVPRGSGVRRAWDHVRDGYALDAPFCGSRSLGATAPYDESRVMIVANKHRASYMHVAIHFLNCSFANRSASANVGGVGGKGLYRTIEGHKTVRIVRHG